MLEYRVNGKTGRGSWHTREEWDIINGLVKPTIEVVDGEVVEEEPLFGIGARLKRRRDVARYVNFLVSQPKETVSEPQKKPRKPMRDENQPTNPTMYEPC